MACQGICDHFATSNVAKGSHCLGIEQNLAASYLYLFCIHGPSVVSTEDNKDGIYSSLPSRTAAQQGGRLAEEADASSLMRCGILPLSVTQHTRVKLTQGLVLVYSAVTRNIFPK